MKIILVNISTIDDSNMRIVFKTLLSFLGYCLLWNSGALPAQSFQIRGVVEEKAIRPDGKIIYIPIQGAKVYLKSNPRNWAVTNAQGQFALMSSLVDQEARLVAEMEQYEMLSDRGSSRRVPYLVYRKSMLNRPVQIYLSKKVAANTSMLSNSGTYALNGQVAQEGSPISDVEVKIEGLEQIHDNTDYEGRFEIYLPDNQFDPQRAFHLVLTKEEFLEVIPFNNLADFRNRQPIVFSNYPSPYLENSPEVRTNVENEGKDPDIEIPRNESGDSKEARIDRRFREFIDKMDQIDFRNLSTEEIRSLKDSLNKYADYITELRAEMDRIRGRVAGDSLSTVLQAEKRLAETEKALAEKEKELVKAELANKNKTIIILSLLIVMIVLSSLSYYYFYINKKIANQATELDRRNRFIEFLLRELNHRVTNNLQVISSMLKRKIRRLPDENAKNALREINKRVLDIATVHVGLYSKNDSRITKLHDYLSNITDTLEKLYGFSEKGIRILIEAPNIEIAHKHAVYFGLIVNELVTNSLKYAFEDVHDPELRVEIKLLRDKTFFLKIQDNGKGIPSNFNLEEAKSSGLKLVSLITKMLEGSFQMSSQQGTKFEMTLKMK